MVRLLSVTGFLSVMMPQLTGAILGAGRSPSPPDADLAGRRLALELALSAAAVAADTASGRRAPTAAPCPDSGVFSLAAWGEPRRPECHASRKNISRPRSSLMVVLQLNRSFVPD
jgi:hypothetical protein